MIVNINKFYKRENAEAMLFAWVNCLLFNLPTITIEKAILNFMKHHNIDEDMLNVDTAKTTYYRMQKEYIESQKSTN